MKKLTYNNNNLNKAIISERSLYLQKLIQVILSIILIDLFVNYFYFWTNESNMVYIPQEKLKLMMHTYPRLKYSTKWLQLNAIKIKQLI